MLRKIQKKQGFTLVEIMIVVAIIIVVAALSIHSLLRARIIANEAAAMRSLKALQTALESYRTINGRFPGEGAGDLTALVSANPPYLDNSWRPLESGGYVAQRQGYYIEFKYVSGDGQEFFIQAFPVQSGVTGKRSFLLSQCLEAGIPDGEIYTTGGAD